MPEIPPRQSPVPSRPAAACRAGAVLRVGRAARVGLALVARTGNHSNELQELFWREAGFASDAAHCECVYRTMPRDRQAGRSVRHDHVLALSDNGEADFPKRPNGLLASDTRNTRHSNGHVLFRDAKSCLLGGLCVDPLADRDAYVLQRLFMGLPLRVATRQGRTTNGKTFVTFDKELLDTSSLRPQQPFQSPTFIIPFPAVLTASSVFLDSSPSPSVCR